MTHLSTRLRLGGALLLLCLTASVALADQVKVKMTIAAPNPLPWGGVYVNPYRGTVTGTPMAGVWPVVCLDLNEWAAEQKYELYDEKNTLSSYGSQVGPGNWTMKQRYDGAARLAAELFGGPPTNLSDADKKIWRGMRSFAIWYMFDKDVFTNSKVKDPVKEKPNMQGAIVTLANTALINKTWVSYTVFDPIPHPTSGDGSPSYQRMLGNVHVPEPSALASLGLNLSGLVGLVLLLRRRSRRQA